jgi:hypothetical protein
MSLICSPRAGRSLAASWWAAFLDELQQTLQDLFTRYGGAEGDAFRLAVACYPKGDPDDRA